MPNSLDHVADAKRIFLSGAEHRRCRSIPSPILTRTQARAPQTCGSQRKAFHCRTDFGPTALNVDHFPDPAPHEVVAMACPERGRQPSVSVGAGPECRVDTAPSARRTKRTIRVSSFRQSLDLPVNLCRTPPPYSTTASAYKSGSPSTTSTTTRSRSGSTSRIRPLTFQSLPSRPVSAVPLVRQRESPSCTSPSRPRGRAQRHRPTDRR